jgi:hypothetical protein
MSEMSLKEQVALAVGNYPAEPLEDDAAMDTGMLMPNQRAFALGWIAANQIIKARYASTGLDAVPIYHPEMGWDRFLLSRRIAGEPFKSETANSFGMLMLSGPDAPRLTKPGGDTKLAMGEPLLVDPEGAIREMLAQIPVIPVGDKDLGQRWRDRRQHYPRIYEVITQLILQYPGMIAAREIFVDDQPLDGAYHPLYIHGVVKQPSHTYNWFLVHYGDYDVFVNAHGFRVIYRTDRPGWATVKKQPAEETNADLKNRFRGWLRIDGRLPEKKVD